MQKNIEKITKQLLEEIGEDPNREGLLKTPSRVAKAWKFFSKGYNQSLEELINQVDFKLKQNSLDCKYLFTDSL